MGESPRSCLAVSLQALSRLTIPKPLIGRRREVDSAVLCDVVVGRTGPGSRKRNDQCQDDENDDQERSSAKHCLAVWRRELLVMGVVAVVGEALLLQARSLSLWKSMGEDISPPPISHHLRALLRLGSFIPPSLESLWHSVGASRVGRQSFFRASASGRRCERD